MDLIPQLPSTTSRFKFCWLQNDEDNRGLNKLKNHKIPLINIGEELANYIKPVTPSTDLSLKVSEHLSNLLNGNAKQLGEYDYPLTAIYNIGIVREPSLNIKFENILKDVCRSIGVILIWDGQYKDGNFIQESDLNSEVYLSFSQPLIELSL